MTVTGEALAAIALEAGVVIMEVYHSDMDVETKSDDSPVTIADQRAEAIILERLAALDPDLPVLAEEAVAAGHIPEVGERFALVDPLDGTKEFIRKGQDFTVNIGIIEHGVPVMGVVYAPATGRLFIADGPGSAWQGEAAPGGEVPAATNRTPMHIRKAPSGGLAAVASKSHRTPETDAFLEKFPIGDLVGAGSSLKFCLVAAGEADIYPRLGRTMEWDTAAGHAIARAAGGRVLTMDGKDLAYGKVERGYDNPHFVVYGDVEPPAA